MSSLNLIYLSCETSLVTYAFDKLSNRISKNDNGNITKYTYDANNRLLTENDKVYTYDKNGNTITITENGVSTTYTYFDFGKVESITDQATKESYTYDYQGRRIRKESEIAEKTEVFNYLLDDNGLVYNVLAEYDDVLHATSIYTYGNDIISIENQDETSYYIVDGQGSTRALTDVNGTITDTYTFDAFGNILEQTGETYNPYLYNQEQFDQATGLYYLRNRYMNPSTGRFVSMDSYAGSIYDPISLHKYLYANGNPTTYTDPTGYNSTLAEQGAAITIIGILTACVTVRISSFGNTRATILPETTFELDTADINTVVIFGGIGIIGNSLSWGIEDEVTEQQEDQLSKLYIGTISKLIASEKTKNKDDDPKIVFRALKEQDSISIAAGKGISAKNPFGNWTLDEHILRGSRSEAMSNDPYISTTSDIMVANFFNKANGYGIVAIDLDKVPKNFINYPMIQCTDSKAKKLASNQSEIAIYQYIPQEAIVGYYK